MNKPADYRILNGTALKLLALVTMTVDHAGLLLLNDLTVCRIIGRLAFPIFAFMIAEGCRYTRNPTKYFFSVFGLGVFCQIVYYITDGLLYMNILISLSLSMLIIFAVNRAKRSRSLPAWCLPIGLTVAIFAVNLVLERLLAPMGYQLDYGFAGVMLPVLISLSDDRPVKLGLTALGLVLVAIFWGGAIQWWSLLALLPLALYNGKPGKHRMKLLFYIYYPLHLAVIYGIDLLLSR